MACIDRKTSKVRWKSKVFGSFWGNATGRHLMWVALKEQNKRVVVFGSAHTGLHVEAFSPEDGTNLFRFSTSYARE
jgi:hypothetical protein